jgi:uncharacterized protein
MKFEWDEAKRLSNIRKHGVDFNEAKAVFLDLDRLESLDDRYDYREERIIAVGSSGTRLLAVVYVERGNILRLISTRVATRDETDEYIQAQTHHE